MGMTTRRRLSNAAFVLGAVLLVAVLVWYVLQRSLEPYGQIALALSIACLAAGILLDAERIRQLLTGQRARHGTNTLLITLAFIGILAVVNFLAYSAPRSIDLTESQEFTLSPESMLTLSRLADPVQIIGFYTPELADGRDRMRALLDQYAINSQGKLSFDFVDPRANPLAADRYGVQRDGSVVVVVGGAHEVVAYADEQALTSALVRLLNPDERKVYFVTGHGERDLQAADEAGYSQVLTALEGKNYQVLPLSLTGLKAVPQDALSLVLAGPTVPLSDEETRLLTQYLDNGGGVVVLADPAAGIATGQAVDPLGAYLAEASGIRYRDDLVFDLASTLPLTAIASSYGTHPITDRMQNLGTYYPSARSLSLDYAGATVALPVALVETASSSWGETDYQSLAEGGNVSFDEAQDTPGPVVLAAAAEDQATGSRVVVIGDSDFASNASFFGLGNGDLLVNSVDWASGQEQLISLTPKPAISRFMMPPSTQAIGAVFLVTVVLIPGAIVGAGTYVWWSRRKRS
jgi:ABC-type uncharacterized transport system involved in gliding motility auxiliary subunit